MSSECTGKKTKSAQEQQAREPDEDEQSYAVYAILNGPEFRRFEELCRRSQRTTSFMASRALHDWLSTHNQREQTP